MKKEHAQEQLQDMKNLLNNSLWTEYFNIAGRIEECEQRLESATDETIKEMCEDGIKKELKNLSTVLELMEMLDNLTADKFAEIIEILDR